MASKACQHLKQQQHGCLKPPSRSSRRYKTESVCNNPFSVAENRIRPGVYTSESITHFRGRNDSISSLCLHQSLATQPGCSRRLDKQPPRVHINKLIIISPYSRSLLAHSCEVNRFSSFAVANNQAKENTSSEKSEREEERAEPGALVGGRIEKTLRERDASPLVTAQRGTQTGLKRLGDTRMNKM